MMQQEDWMNLQEFRPLADVGVPWTEIARLAGCDPRTAKKYLSGPPRPPRYRPRPSTGKVIDPFTGTIDAWLRASKGTLHATTIYERLAAEPYHFPGSYQRVKQYVRARRPEILAELGLPDRSGQMHRRFEVPPGSQAQVDWGDEGTLADGTHVYSFHMVLSYSRDPFCRYTTATDLATFWACHSQAFAHFGGVPATILYDRTKTVIKKHVGRGEPVVLHPEAEAYAAHYGFAIRVCWPERPQSKGRVERVVPLAREKVLNGCDYVSPEQMQDAWAAWLPSRRAQVHRTHGEIIAVRAAVDRAALWPVPERPYTVCERHLRVVGKDALVSFEASLYSVPWMEVRPRQRVELRVTRSRLEIWSLGPQARRLASHARAASKGCWVVDEAHWDGLPDGSRPGQGPLAPKAVEGEGELPALETLSARAPAIAVARRDPASYDALFATAPVGGR
jgi:transposase